MNRHALAQAAPWFDRLLGFTYRQPAVDQLAMQITLLPQRRQVELGGRRRVREVLRELGLLPGTAMVIRGDELVPEHEMLEADDVIEIRSVISGGS